MFNVKKDVILKQKLGQLTAKFKEVSYWANILEKDLDEFTKEYYKISAEWIEHMNMILIDNKLQEYCRKFDEPVEVQLKNILMHMDICRDFFEDHFNRSRICQVRLRETLNTLMTAMQILKGPNVTLEQIQAVTFPDFDWAINNFNPSDLDLEILKEKVGKARDAITKHKNAIEALDLDDPGKIEEASAGNEGVNEAEEVGADLQNE